VGAAFLASIFIQTVLGYSARRTGVPFLPFALAITVDTIVARHLLANPQPPRRRDLRVGRRGGGRRAGGRGTRTRGMPSSCCPGYSALGLGVGMVFAPVSVSSVAGIPASHAGVASGFPMIWHEIGAAQGVAVLSAVASTAGSLATQGRRRRRLRARVRRGPACIVALFAVVALLREPAAQVDSETAGMRMH
jgi:hypothetical protein